MNKFKVLVLSIFVVFQAHAQTSINQNHMPAAGDTLRFSVAALDTTILQNYQAAGANQTWRFDSIQAIRQGVSRFYTASQTPYSNQVSNRIAEKIADTVAMGGINLYDVYEFYDLDTTEFAKDYRGATVPTAFGNISIAPAFSDKDEVYQFPLNYQNRDSSTFNFTYNNLFPPAYLSSSGYRINEVDAWGTLHTPFGTFNCIRVITDLVSYDTVSFGTTNFGMNSHTREYKWLTTQFGIPAMTVSGNVVAGVFIPSTVQYRDSFRNVPSIFAPFAQFDSDTTTLLLGDSVQLNNNTISITPYTSNWSISPSTFRWANGTNSSTQSPLVQFLDTGYYDVQLIVSNREGSDTLLIPNYIRVNALATSIKKYNHKGELSHYPNPVKAGSRLFFKSPTGKQELILYSINGKEVANFQLQSGEQSIQIPQLNTGTYFLRYISKGNIVQQKLIIKK